MQSRSEGMGLPAFPSIVDGATAPSLRAESAGLGQGAKFIMDSGRRGQLGTKGQALLFVVSGSVSQTIDDGDARWVVIREYN